jgi:4-amino-4-deoxychorismate lyase
VSNSSGTAFRARVRRGRRMRGAQTATVPVASWAHAGSPPHHRNRNARVSVRSRSLIIGERTTRVFSKLDRLETRVETGVGRRVSMAASSGDGRCDNKHHAPPVVSGEEFHRRASEICHPRARDAHASFYSSWTDCITCDPSAFVLPMDDHMAHRGHGVFDTAHLHLGKLHMLDRHVERFFRSMEQANIVPPFDEETTKSLILRVAAAGGLREGQLRFYASAGPGGFALDQAECVRSVFYCVSVKKRSSPAGADSKSDAPASPESEADSKSTQSAFEADFKRDSNESPPRNIKHQRLETFVQIKGVSVVTSKIPIKPPFFATVKSTNYLPNALVVADAKSRGAEYGIWLTADGAHVAEGPSMNVGFVVGVDRGGEGGGAGGGNADGEEQGHVDGGEGNDDEEEGDTSEREKGEPRSEQPKQKRATFVFKTPAWDETLAGCTVARVVEFVNEGRFKHLGITGPALVGKITLEEAKNANEAMLIGSVINCLPIVTWDGAAVGKPHAGKVGAVAAAIAHAIAEDFERNEPELTPVPYELFE